MAPARSASGPHPPDAEVLRRDEPAGARVVLSFREPPDRRPRVAERAVVDRHRAAARWCPHRPQVLRRRPGGSAARRRHLPAGRLRVDAERERGSAVPRLEAGVGVPAGPLGPLLRAHDPLSRGHWITDPPHPGSVLARLVAADDDVRGRQLRQRRRPAVRASVPRMRGSIFAGASTRRGEGPTGSRTQSPRRGFTSRSVSVCLASSPATPTTSGASPPPTAARATPPGADRRVTRTSTARWCPRPRQAR